MSPFVKFNVALLLALTAAACTDPAPLGTEQAELTAAQCSFFAASDRVTICHRTGSARNPYTIIRTSTAGCASGHADHAGDYVASSDPASPAYDPTCGGQGCFPAGAPFDGSVECCEGLTAVGGVCTAVAVPFCGDQVVNPGEQCDDGNVANGDGCSGTCIQERCGNGVVQPAIGEQCDDGNSNDSDACRNTCTLPFCGDYALSGAETCDDGNQQSGDGCSATCAQEICGDGIFSPSLGEQCDDGNQQNGDGCSATCIAEGCGNGIVEAYNGEQCDDGNFNNFDACSNACRQAFCGDGIVSPGEQCDDGNQQSGDGCTATCGQEFCGDGIVSESLGESCDDGNTVNYDGCSSWCGPDAT